MANPRIFSEVRAIDRWEFLLMGQTGIIIHQNTYHFHISKVCSLSQVKLTKYNTIVVP